MKTIFNWVASGLLATAEALHLTYNEINIIVYYLLIPLSWTLLWDFSGVFPYTTLMLVCVWIGISIGTYGVFSQWCDRFFLLSQKFLCLFNCLGSNYIISSVIICVLVPIPVYVFLIYWYLIH